MRRWNWHFVRDERGAFGGFPTDLLAGILAAYGLDIIITIFATLLKAFVASVVLINYGHAYSMQQNGIDPQTSTPYVQEATQAFGGILPVTNASSAAVSIPPTLGEATQPGELLLYIGADPNRGGFDELTVDYALQLPLGIPTWNGSTWTTVSPKPFQLFFNVDFYQEW